MVAVVTVAMAVALAAVAIIMLVEDLVIGVRGDVLADVEIMVLTAIVAVALEFLVTVSHSADVVVDILIDASTGLIIGVLPAFGVDEVNVNIFAAVTMTVLEFTMPTT